MLKNFLQVNNKTINHKVLGITYQYYHCSYILNTLYMILYTFMIKLGPLLRQQRLKKKLTIGEVAKETKIKESFLEALEKGNYERLPSPAYAKGFVSNYATFLGLPKGETVALFRREFDEKKAYKVLPDSLTKREPLPLKRSRLRQSLIIIVVILILSLGYLLFQYRAAFLAPSLSISEPKQGASVHEEVIIKGKTDPEATVTVNKKPVSLKNDGSFSKQLLLFPGKETITITAQNRFGKEATIERQVTVK